MAPRKVATDLGLIVGRLQGDVAALVKSIGDAAAERRLDAEIDALYRKEVRENLARLADGMGAIPAIIKRLDALDDDENERSLVRRFSAASMKLDKQEIKLAFAATIIGGALWLVALAVSTFFAGAKDFILKKFGII